MFNLIFCSMVKKLNSMPDYRARMPKQPHDLSRSFAFTTCVGAEFPVARAMLHPHDELYFSSSMFTRLNAISLPALAQVDFHLDYFFVPLTVMYTPANVLHYGTDDLISSLFDGSGANGLRDVFPRLDINNAIRALNSEQITIDGQTYDWKEVASMPRPVGSPTNGFLSAGQSVFRLLDFLGYNPLGVFNKTVDSRAWEHNNPTITPWFLAAYQACHQLYFRNDDREKKDYCYNFDRHFKTYNFNLGWSVKQDWLGDDYVYLDLLQIRYRSRYKDYFNSVKVSPLSSGTSLRDFYDSSNNSVSSAQYLSGVRQFLGVSPSDSILQFGGNDNDPGNTFGADSTNVLLDTYESKLSTASIRSMFALEKLVRVVGRANKDYESQVLAHFGVKVPHDVMHNITHIGEETFSLTPSVVESHADTTSQGGAALGAIGGQGVSNFEGRKFSFTAPCHGVFMAILSSIPRLRYEAGFDKALIFNERLDFWQPEFDRLGMQPLFSYEATVGGITHSTRVGWQFGYEHLKRSYDRVSVAFKSNPSNSFAPWVLSHQPYNPVYYTPQVSNLESYLGYLEYQNFLANPLDLDKVMTVGFYPGWRFSEGTDLFEQSPWLVYATDPFIHDYRFNCKLVNFMSEYGEPELDV